MTRWLTADEQHTWRTYLDVVSRHLEQFEDDLQAKADLALTDYEILVMLSEAPDGELRMTDLARRVIISKSRLTYRVDRLCARGVLARVDDPDDRRGIRAKLTPEGRALLENAAPGHVAKVRSLIFDVLSPDEADAFGSILEKLSAVCSAETAAGR